MKLWLVKRTDDIGWDNYDGFVIRAESEQEARDLARKEGGSGWTSENYVDCKEISQEGPQEVLLESFNAG